MRYLQIEMVRKVSITFLIIIVPHFGLGAVIAECVFCTIEIEFIFHNFISPSSIDPYGFDEIIWIRYFLALDNYVSVMWSISFTSTVFLVYMSHTT